MERKPGTYPTVPNPDNRRTDDHVINGPTPAVDEPIGKEPEPDQNLVRRVEGSKQIKLVTLEQG